MPLHDPGAPPDAGEGALMRAKDLKNKPCVFHPVSEGEWPASGDKKANAYIACDVWVLDRQGVVEHGTGVKVSWWRAVEQLRAHMGSYIGARPVEQEDNSVVLDRLSDAAKKVAAEVVAELEAADPETRPFTEDNETF